MKVDALRMRRGLLYIVSFGIIGALCCVNFKNLNHIYIINDEFGYWGTAASIVGYDWKDLLNETPYYAWGYSIWLVPIIKVFHTPELWYKAAIILNIFFLWISYCLCNKIGKRLFKDIPDELIAVVSLVTIIYPSNIVYAQAAWSEMLSCMLMWLITYLLVYLEENFSWKSYICIILLLGYAYSVHNRNIGIVLAGVICLCMIFVKQKKKFYYFILMFILLGVCYGINDVVKGYQIDLLMGESEVSAVNNVALNSETISFYIFKLWSSLKLFIMSAGGKLIYLLIGTGLTLPIAILGVVGESIRSIREKHGFAEISIAKWWCILSLAAMWGICSLQMLDWDIRKDMIVYGRYMENAIGPALFLGIMYAVTLVKVSRLGEMIALVILLAGYRRVYQYVDAAEGGFNSLCSPIVGAFWELEKNATVTFKVMGLVMVGILVLLFVASYLKKQRIRGGIILMAFMVIYSVMGYSSAKYSNDIRAYVDGITVPLRTKLLEEYPERELYLVEEGEVDWSNLNPKYFQFLVPDKKIHVIKNEELFRALPENAVILLDPSNENARFEMECNGDVAEIDSSIMFKVYAEKGE